MGVDSTSSTSCQETWAAKAQDDRKRWICGVSFNLLVVFHSLLIAA
jgi:hypothetical protein